MYFTSVDGTNYAIKPMNCPGCLLVYNSRKHSYREFPIRLAELGLVHRYEPSGQMHGLVRVRQFTQDDAHIFCTTSQIEPEIIGVIELIQQIYQAFGFSDYHVELSTKPDKHIGSDQMWETATNSLRSALEKKNINYVVNEGDGAFYGPKIDFHIEDCLQRSWQLGTIQLDFSMPERFELKFVDSDNSEKTPVMIHRAILGSLERFLGILIEHYGGNLPIWLAPEQVRILPISEKTNDYASQLVETFKANGLRVSLDASNEKIGAKIVKAHADKVSFMAIVGPKEAEQNQLSLRYHSEKGDEKSVMSVDDFIEKIKQKIVGKDLDFCL